MANNLKDLLNKPLPRDDKNRASLFAVVSVYLLYLAYGVLRDTANGVSQMSVTASVACAAFLALGGLGTMAWTIRLWRKHKAQTVSEATEDTNQACVSMERQKVSSCRRLSSRE